MDRDDRIKAKIFPVRIFASAFFVFGLLSTVQMRILANYIDISELKTVHIIMILALWITVAVSFTLITRLQIIKRYQKPVEELAEAARRVAEGDFSVYLPSHHTSDKADHFDVLIRDFNKMVEELGSIETLKTDFVSNVSHEIKTPLAVINNNAQLLNRSGITEQQRFEYTADILSAVRRLSELIYNMLKLNKLEKQVITPAPESFDISAQVCECALQFEDMWERKNISFEAELEERVIVEADAGLLELVWTNLFSNAFKFTPEGGTVSLQQKSDGKYVAVSISDTGCGMSEETVGHIFDKFYQGDSSHSTEGNGLGLPLVQRILQLSDGTVSVKSILGEGTVFTVTLPIRREEV